MQTNADIAATEPVLSQAPPPGMPPDAGGVDVLEYLRILRRRWLLVVLVTALSTGVTAFVTMRMTKIYRATATVRIETQAPQVLGQNVEDVVEMGTGSFWSNAEYYETQYRIIESRNVAARVVREFHLTEDPEFLGIPPEKRASFVGVSEEEASIAFQGMVTVEPVKDSRLVKVHVDNRDPERAKLYANALVKAYVDQNLDTMLNSTVEAVDWLSQQLDDARASLTSSEEILYEYKEKEGILSISLEDRQNILAAQITEVARRLTEAQAKRIEIQARKSAMSAAAEANDPMSVPVEALNSSPLIQQLKQNYAQLSQEHGELSERYGEMFPRIVELKAKMSRIKEDISREVNNILTAVDSELAAARSTEAGLKAALEELKKQAMELGQKEIEYNKLAREKDNNEKVYQMLIGRSKEADLSRLLRVNNVRILDPALKPESPIKPRVQLNLAVAFAFGLFLGIGLAFLIEYSDKTVKTQDDLEGLATPFLGIIPSIGSSTAGAGGYYGYYYGSGKRRKKRRPKPESADKKEIDHDRFVHQYPKSQVAESCRSIRTNLLFMSADREIRRILITSPSPQEGKTTVAANLAIVMAQSGSRILLVDTDMRRPRIHKAFGVQRPTKGISTMVLGESTAEETIISTDIPNLDILVCGPTPPNPAEILHTDRFHQVVEDLTARYDRVLFDSPPVGVVTDAAILSKLVDGTVIIVKSLRTTRDALRHAVGILRDIDASIFGTVLNDLDLAKRKYGRHYYYYYYKKYGYYYGHGEEGRDSEEDREERLAEG